MRYARRSGNTVSPSEDWRGAVVCLAATFFARFGLDDWRMDICDERSFGDPERRPKVME